MRVGDGRRQKCLHEWVLCGIPVCTCDVLFILCRKAVCVWTYVCMFVCMYVCLYVHMYVCIDACTCVCMHVCMYALFAACTYAYHLTITVRTLVIQKTTTTCRSIHMVAMLENLFVVHVHYNIVSSLYTCMYHARGKSGYMICVHILYTISPSSSYTFHYIMPWFVHYILFWVTIISTI